MSLRIFDPSSGGDTRSWRASTCSDSSRYFVCSAYWTRGRRSRKSGDALWYARPQPRQTSASARAGEHAVAVRTANEREQGGGDHRADRDALA